MVNYSVGAATLMGVAAATIANAAAASSLRTQDDSTSQQRRRNLYQSTEHFRTETDTKCNEVIEGHPQVCVLVCTETTSIFMGDKLLDERSTTHQRKCDDDDEEEDSGSISGDGDGWKGPSYICESQRSKVSYFCSYYSYDSSSIFFT